MKVYLATPRGFCAGVVRAIEIVERALEQHGPPIYVKHQIVHNDVAVSDLDKKGAITVESIDEVPKGAKVVFSAHGSPPSDYEVAKKRGLKVIDATCPLVTKVHNEAKKYQKEGRKVVLIGHANHQEVVGTMGQIDGMVLYDDSTGKVSREIDKESKVAVLTQTTLSVNDTAKAVSNLSKQYENVVVKNDICYATTNRQEAIYELAKNTKRILVIGSSNSSNCQRLVELGRSEGAKTSLVNGAGDLDLEELKSHASVGITSGASTPEKVVKEVVERLSPSAVVELGKGPEKIYFNLPKN